MVSRPVPTVASAARKAALTLTFAFSCVAPAFAQESPHFEQFRELAAVSQTEDKTQTGEPAPSPPSEQEDPSLAAILERLRQTEERLMALETPEPKAADKPKEPEKPKSKSWFEKYRINGYGQIRINEAWPNDDSAAAQYVGDSSIGDNQSFIIRRARLILSGDVGERLSIYLQPDFASNVPGSPDANQFAQIRDWYADVYFDTDKEYRIRLGQSKIPYGWENLQSSQNRLPLDRNDALNSAVRNERDLGAIFYWTPQWAQDFFKFAVDEGLKGSGNYGVFGVGVYNGQGGSFREQNDNLHVVSRLTLPITTESGQMIEAAIQGYTGYYTVLSSTISPLGVGPAVRPTGTLETGNVDGILDQRVAGTFVYYPQPFGFQTEWTVGRGPGLNDEQTEVIDRPLYGGYAMMMYRHITPCHGEWLPFLRYNYYKGGYKSERNSPFSDIDEWELGLEWQLSKNFEFVTMYTITDRTNTTARSTANTLSYEQFEGEILRFQMQFRY